MAAMKVGIVGYAGAGKTTVFNALTGMSADTGFGGKDKANLGMIKVPDERIEFLTETYNPKKETLAEIAFVDVAGPTDASKQDGLDSRIVGHMREAEALVHVVRDFDNPALQRGADPVRDFESFEGDIIISDMLQVDNRLARLKKERKLDSKDGELMQKLYAQLEEGKPLRTLELDETQRGQISGYQFLSLKPCVALVNVADEKAGTDLPADLKQSAADRGMFLIAMAARAEAEIAELDADDQRAFLDDLGLKQPARARFINAVYEQLNLISFLTAGEDECRAWTIRRDIDARKAAGKIHSDIERGFIRAEVIAFEDFKTYPSEAKCRDAGKLRLEGKTYIVQDGDIINFRFNV